MGLALFMYWGFPKPQYKALGKMKNVENEYIFCDEVIKVSSKSEEYNGEGELKYSMIPKVIETSKYLLVYQSKRQAFLIEKTTIINGTLDDIREKLTQYVKVTLSSKGEPVIKWEKVKNAVKYTVYIYDANGKQLKTSTTTKLSLTHSSAVKGKKCCSV